MTLSKLERALLRLSVAICLGRWDVLRRVRQEAGSAVGREWREAVLQTHLFAGFPRVVEAYRILEEVGGLGTPAPEEVDPEEGSLAGGRALFGRVYAENAVPVQSELESYHPLLARWIQDHAYGRVLSRPGLTPAQREILSVGCLAALGQKRQLASHARGAVLCGADPQALRDALELLEDLLERERIPPLLEVLEQFAPLSAER
jgi:alkylhydroperoxidase/carboxymuconolactone decarboxylase family protein YurZ